VIWWERAGKTLGKRPVRPRFFAGFSSRFFPSGRIYTVTGVANSITTPYATNVQYAPQGAIQNLTLNNSLNNKVLGESWGFNPRQQPTSLTVTAGGGTQLMNLGWTYGGRKQGRKQGQPELRGVKGPDVFPWAR